MLSIKQLLKVGYGPSSSHTVGPGRAAEQFYKMHPNATRFKVTLYGSLALTGIGHGTEDVIRKMFGTANVEVAYEPDTELPRHPNGMFLEAFNHENKQLDNWTVYSVGGGDLWDDKEIFTQEKHIYPFSTMDEILKWCQTEGRTFWEYVEIHEGPEIWDYLGYVWKVMKNCIKRGLEAEGILPGPLKLQRKAAQYHAKALNARAGTREKGLIFSYALAVSEENAAGAKVVIAPTCGASGVLPSALYFQYKTNEVPEARILRALATGALIGNLVKTNGSISGAEAGCQAEVGTAAAMAAAALAYIKGGTAAQIEYAAEMAFEHYLGLTCDPIAGYVQIPCIERNAFAADRAGECAVYAIFSDGEHKIPFDKVVITMMETGRDMQSAYRETGAGGLARIWNSFNN